MNAQKISSNKFYIPVEFTENRVTYNPTVWNSIFIPSLPSAFVNEDILTYLIQEIYQLGSVKRVDIIKKENATNRLMAFVHFNHWFNSSSTVLFREKMEKDGLVDVFGYKDKYGDYIDYNKLLDSKIKKDTFLRFMVNKTPIKDTELNIHQLADLLERADHNITEKDAIINRLQLELFDYKIKMENLISKNEYLTNEVSLLNIETMFIKNRNQYGLSDGLSDGSDAVSDMDENELNYVIEKPKLIRELYVDETLENASMINLYDISESYSLTWTE